MSSSTNQNRDAGEDRVTEVTKDAQEHEAHSSNAPDRPPTPDEEAAAERTKLDPKVAEHERGMGRIGAEVKGEGEIR